MAEFKQSDIFPAVRKKLFFLPAAAVEKINILIMLQLLVR